MSAAEAIEEREGPRRIAPQPGPQHAFVASSATIAIYGGAAGGGKSYGLLLCPCQFLSLPKFRGMVFRRELEQAIGPGSIWEDSCELYGSIGGVANGSKYFHTFPSGARVGFKGLEQEKDKFKWQGKQLGYLGFDELTHFTDTQFWYLFSRARSVAGMRPFVRATCNPDPDSWVLDLISWWIYPKGHELAGYPIPERSGVLRWLVRIDGEMHWYDTAAEGKEAHPGSDPISVTFIGAKLDDNPILTANDPEYRAKLEALPRHERLQLQGGNWHARLTAGMLFRRAWFTVIDHLPREGCVRQVRGWDRAATEPHDKNPDPDFTASVKIGRLMNDDLVVLDVQSFRATPGAVRETMRSTAEADGISCEVAVWEDPGQAGVEQTELMLKTLEGFRVQVTRAAKSKVVYAEAVSPQAEHGRIKVLRGPWNDRFFAQLEAFPSKSHDDIVDALSGAFKAIAQVYVQGARTLRDLEEKERSGRRPPRKVAAGLM